jgi:hypothetical protein
MPLELAHKELVSIAKPMFNQPVRVGNDDWQLQVRCHRCQDADRPRYGVDPWRSFAQSE